MFYFTTRSGEGIRPPRNVNRIDEFLNYLIFEKLNNNELWKQTDVVIAIYILYDIMSIHKYYCGYERITNFVTRRLR